MGYKIIKSDSLMSVTELDSLFDEGYRLVTVIPNVYGYINEYGTVDTKSYDYIFLEPEQKAISEEG